ncbi:hypothetical protein OBBRIDRAFT_794261 [Obba rivulosa]|uniref:Uncharacterized protein n=1 Tax=Obba rivulosa TaxID=1052685 RepID=A0A8E2ARW9_9APHY|nr:hypothetical protein OBBRIDRAFT_794261 [Obba rivulosa]
MGRRAKYWTLAERKAADRAIRRKSDSTEHVRARRRAYKAAARARESSDILINRPTADTSLPQELPEGLVEAAFRTLCMCGNSANLACSSSQIQGKTGCEVHSKGQEPDADLEDIRMDRMYRARMCREGRVDELLGSFRAAMSICECGPWGTWSTSRRIHILPYIAPGKSVCLTCFGMG